MATHILKIHYVCNDYYTMEKRYNKRTGDKKFSPEKNSPRREKPFREKPGSERNSSSRPRYKKEAPVADEQNERKPKNFRDGEKYSKPRPGKTFGSSEKRPRRSENSMDENRQGKSRNTSDKTTNKPFPERGDKFRTRSFEKSFSRKKSSFSEKGREETRLNKYIANSGMCSRREADVLISTGVVTVNGEVIITMGYKVKPGDRVCVDGRELKSERKVYLLLNKPKDTITTTEDPSGRKTVMDLVKDACRERVYPVGRLDRNTTGLLLLTNDGDMAKRLMHPSHKIIKVYEATLDKNISREDMLTISRGVSIEDDFIPVDGIAWPDPAKKNVVGIELHSGKYHVVKRIFEQFGYEVVRLDRTMFGPLTKKNLPRGTWRMLSEEEISILHRL